MQPLWQGFLGVSPSTCTRESRGRRPWAGVWGCPPDFITFFPLPSRKGARGIVRTPFVANPPSGESRGVQPLWQGFLGVSPSTYKRESRGRRPLAGVWGCPPDFIIFFPLPRRKGARGIVQTPFVTNPPQAGSPERCNLSGRGFRGCPLALARGNPEGAALWQGSGGVPQTSLFSSPFLLGRGPGG